MESLTWGNFGISVVANLFTSGLVAGAVYLLWRYRDRPALSFLQSTSRKKNQWYTVWVPSERAPDEWVCQLVEIRSSFLRTLLFRTNKVEHRFKDGQVLKFQWTGVGRLGSRGESIIGEWTSTIYALSGFFHLEIKEPDRLLVGSMSAATRGIETKYAPFIVASDLGEIEVAMRSHRADKSRIERAISELKAMAKG